MRSRSFAADSAAHIPRATLSCLAACTVIVAADSASADTIRYVDRNGRSHQITVQREPTPKPPAVEQAPAPEPTADTNPVVFSVPYLAHVREAAGRYALPIELIAAVMRIESGGNPRAVSSAGAMGLMQLMPVTAGEMQVTDAFDPRQNILGGARYLRILINTHDGSVALALAAYHAGASTVEKYGGIPPYPETHKYVTQVIQLYRQYKERNAVAQRAAAAVDED